METPEWDRVADVYAETTSTFCNHHATTLLAAIAAKLPHTKLLLDLGCGTGAFSQAYLARHPRGHADMTILCVDVSPSMVHSTRDVVHKMKRDDCLTKFDFAVLDATDLTGVKDGSVDMIVSLFAAFLIPQREMLFKEVRRVLVRKPNATFVTTAWTSLPFAKPYDTFGPSMEDVLHAAMGVMPKGGTTNMLEEHKEGEEAEEAEEGGFDFKEGPWHIWSDPQQAANLLQTSLGFTDVQVLRAVHSASFHSLQQLWTFVSRASPIFQVDEVPQNLMHEAKGRFAKRLGLDPCDEKQPVCMPTAANIFIASLDLRSDML